MGSRKMLMILVIIAVLAVAAVSLSACAGDSSSQADASAGPMSYHGAKLPGGFRHPGRLTA